MAILERSTVGKTLSLIGRDDHFDVGARNVLLFVLWLWVTVQFAYTFEVRPVEIELIKGFVIH